MTLIDEFTEHGAQQCLYITTADRAGTDPR